VRIVLGNDIPVRDWNDFFYGNAFATPFQSYDFYSLVNSSPAFSAEAAAAYDGGIIHALAVVTLQRSPGLYAFFSRRAIIYGGPLADIGCPEALDLLLGHITSALKGRVIYSETRNLSDYSCFKQIFNKNGWEYVPYLNFHLQTADNDTMIRAVSDSRLRQIKKARSAGVSWRKAASLDDVRAFYLILADLYKKKIRKPLMPWDFFRLFFERQSGVFLLVIYKDKVIGGIMCPVLENKAIYEFYICGLDEEYNEQHPSIIATWAAMEYAAENKIPVFDFMGAGKPGESYGVRDFKARFGGEIVEYGRFLKKMNPLLYRAGALAIHFRSAKKQ
jgi:serine/alanine adding enzyme